MHIKALQPTAISAVDFRYELYLQVVNGSRTAFLAAAEFNVNHRAHTSDPLAGQWPSSTR
jgi:hypothetical protein